MQIGIWGDSITYGGPSEGWVRLLRKALASKDTEVYNRGVCGDTSEDVLKRFAVEAEAIQPRTVIFAVGTNDSKYPRDSKTNKVPFDEFKENMRKLVGDAKERARRVILIGLTEVNEKEINKALRDRKRTSTFLNYEISRYDQYLKELAAEEKIEYIKMKKVLNTSADLEDGIHPNPQGYAKMFDAIFPLFK